MTLDELAQRIARDRHGAEYVELSRRSPLNAVIECAHLAEAIGEDEYNALIHMEADEDFSFFVGPNDPLLPGRRAIRSLPKGVFIACIFVENPKGQARLGKRHLIMPMISLGDGWAACGDPSQVGIGNRNTGWSTVDLDRDLSWLDASVSNGYDLFNRVPAGTGATQLLRMRYRPPGRSPPAASASSAPKAAPGMVWGKPHKSSDLRQTICDAATDLVGLNIEPGRRNRSDTPDRNIFRVNFQFSLAPEAFELLFNSPNEMRGHYYVQADLGDRYIRSLLAAMANAIDWHEALRALNEEQVFGRTVSTRSRSRNRRIIERIKTSVSNGKIWYREGKGTTRRVPWKMGTNDDVSIAIPPNTRWSTDALAKAGNLRALLEDNAVELDRLSELELDTLKSKFNGPRSSLLIAAGANYFHCPPNQSGTTKRPSANVDVKGEWVNARGKPAGFTPPGKHFRGSQIKWFGFT